MRTFKYDPFGNVTSETGTVDAKWRFAGAYWDGQGFYKMGVRWYDPKLGRWTQRDPLDQPLEANGWNAYVYVGNDPVNFIDPDGHCRRRYLGIAAAVAVAAVGSVIGALLVALGAAEIAGAAASGPFAPFAVAAGAMHIAAGVGIYSASVVAAVGLFKKSRRRC